MLVHWSRNKEHYPKSRRDLNQRYEVKARQRGTRRIYKQQARAGGMNQAEFPGFVHSQATAGGTSGNSLSIFLIILWVVCPSLSVSVCFGLPLSVPVCLWLSPFVFVCRCLASVCFCLSLSASFCFWLSLSVSNAKHDQTKKDRQWHAIANRGNIPRL